MIICYHTHIAVSPTAHGNYICAYITLNKISFLAFCDIALAIKTLVFIIFF